MKKILLSKALTATGITLGTVGVVGGLAVIGVKYMMVADGAKKLDETAWSLGGQLGYSNLMEKGDEKTWARNDLSLNEDGKVNYLALGDSVAAGFDGQRDIDAYGYTDFIRDELKGRDKLGTFSKHTFTGITGEDMNSIIEGNMEEEMWESTLNDHKYTDLPKYQKTGEHKIDDKHKSFNEFSGELDKQIEDANLITLNMGANDILGGIQVLGIPLHDITNPTFLKKKNLVPQDIDSKDAVGHFMSAKIAELQAKGIGWIVGHISEIINIDTQRLGEIVVNVGGYVNGALAKIRRLNPGANVVISGYYNPLANFGLITKLAGLDGLIENLNTAIKNAAYSQNIKNGKFNVIYTDLWKMTENLSTSYDYEQTKNPSLAKGESYGISPNVLGVNSSKFIPHVLDIHPSLQGSIMMGKMIMNDYAYLTHAPALVGDYDKDPEDGTEQKFENNNGGLYLFTQKDTNDDLKYVYSTIGADGQQELVLEDPGNKGAPNVHFKETNPGPSWDMDVKELGNMDKDSFIIHGKDTNVYMTRYEEVRERPLPSNHNANDDKTYANYKIGSIYVNSFQLIEEGVLKSLVNSILKSLGEFLKNKIVDTLSTFKTISKETIGEKEWEDYVSMQGIYEHEDPLYVFLNIVASSLGEKFSTDVNDERTLIDVLLENLDASVIGTMKGGLGLLQKFTSMDNILNAILYPIKDRIIPLMDNTTDPANPVYAKSLINLTTNLQGWVYGLNYAPNRLENTRRFWKNVFSFNLLGFNLATMEIPKIKFGSIEFGGDGSRVFDGLFSDNFAASTIALGMVAQFITLGTDTTERATELFAALNKMSGDQYAADQLAALKKYGVESATSVKSASDGFKAGLKHDEVNEQIGDYLIDIFVNNIDNDQGIYYPADIYAPKADS